MADPSSAPLIDPWLPELKATIPRIKMYAPTAMAWYKFKTKDISILLYNKFFFLMQIAYWSRMYRDVFDFAFVIISINARSSHVSGSQRGRTSQSVHNGTKCKIIETKLI